MKLINKANNVFIEHSMIISSKRNKCPTEEMTYKMELISPWQDYHLMPSTQCMNAIYRDGTLEI
jgi:hypothetical protein